MATDAPATPTRLPFAFARAQGVLLDATRQPPRLYCSEAATLQALLEVRRWLGTALQPQRVSDEEFRQLLSRGYQRERGEARQVAEDLDSDVDLSRLVEDIPEHGDLMDADDDAPVIRLINAILSQAVREQASDIHIETFEERLSVRFRIDGVMSEVLSPRRMLAPLLVSRLKVMARLDIAERRVPQDGRISVRLAGRAVDIRVSTIPAAHGERVVLRLLDKQAAQLQLAQLRMPGPVFDGFCATLHAPHGIVLVTGPTGSGKTTTLYAGLGEINDASRNILTIEDPVEYLLPGIGQMPVNTRVGMSFARGLRAILRQDPDVVMVGEIRDRETAEIAVQASLTGHLVLSTLHTNTAVGAITRLVDMGIEPFLLSSGLSAVMAQRLVRLLCPHCRVQAPATPAERRQLGLDAAADVALHHPRGCERCNQTGYRGRTAIYEWVPVNDAMRRLIHDGAGEQALQQQARRLGPGIREDGMRRVLTGETSLAEVLRVTVN